MYFHSIVKFLTNKDYNANIYFYNYSKEKIVDNALIPFVNGQVVEVNSEGNRSVVNMKSAYSLHIYKTEEKIEKTPEKSFIDIMREKEFRKYDCTKEFIEEHKDKLIDTPKSDLQRKFAETTNSVFVIMKFGDALLDSAYEGVIDPIIRSFNLNPIRVDKIQNSGVITDQIIDLISSSQYVLADLSGERPNTYYEAGFAHAIGKEIIFSIRKNEKIHFDLAGHRFIQWETESELRKLLQERFQYLFEAESRE